MNELVNHIKLDLETKSKFQGFEPFKFGRIIFKQGNNATIEPKLAISAFLTYIYEL